MMPEIAIVLAVLLAAINIFVTEWIRVDVVTLMVLINLAHRVVRGANVPVLLVRAAKTTGGDG